MQTKTDERSLPKGWQWVKLGDVCKQDRQIVEPKSDLASRLLYLSLEHIESNSGRILREPSAPIEDEGKSTTFYFDNHHVLYGKLRPYLNKVALPDFEGRCTTELIPILPTDIDREFLAWVLRRKETVDVAMQEKTGSRMPRANMDNLFALEIPLPPLDEQRRIASRLNEQLAAVESARKAAEEQLHAAYQLPLAYLKEVFEGEEASHWKYENLRNICTSNGQYGTSEKSNTSGLGLPVLGMGNLQEGYIDWSNLKYIEMPQKEEGKYVLEPGDVIFNRTNSVELVGKTAVFDAQQKAIFASYLIRFRLISEKANPHFVSAYINSQIGRKFIEENMARAIGQANVSASKMHKMLIPIPPLERQNQIALKLKEDREATTQLISVLESQQAEIESLPASLLREAFAGQL